MPRRGWARCSARLLLILSFPTGLAAQQPFEPGIYELNISGGPAVTTRVLIDSAGRVLVPVPEVMLLTGIPQTRVGVTYRFDWPPPDFRTDFDPVTGRITRATGDTMLAPGDWVELDGRLHMEAAALARVMGAQVRIEPVDLIVSYSIEGGFPAQRREDAELRPRLRLAEPGRRGTSVQVPYPAATGGLAIDWGATLQLGDQYRTQGVLRTVAGTAIAGGELAVGGNLGIGTELTGDQALFRFTRPFPESRLLSQVTLGTLVTPTAAPVYVTGVHITNAPPVPPVLFDDAVIRPVIPAGWTAEVYDGSFLLGVADNEAEAGVAVPLSYGYTPLRIRLIGPAGQEREEQIQFIVPASRVPARRVEYHAGGGECRGLPCRRFGFADVTWGATSWLSGGVGADAVQTAGNTRFRPHLNVGLSPRPNLALEGGATGTDQLRLGVQHLGRRNSSLSASVAWFSPDDPTAFFEGWRFTAGAAQYVLGRQITASLHGDVDSAGTLQSLQLIGGVPFSRGFLGVHVDHQESRATSFSLRGAMVPRLGRQRVSLTSSIGYREGDIELFEAGANLSIAGGNLASLLQFRPGRSSPALTLTWAVRTGIGQATARAVGSRNASSLLLSAAGGATVAPHRVRPVADAAVGRAAVAGVVFVDDNGNGHHDAGEPIVTDVMISAEGEKAVSDGSGRYQLNNLPPIRVISLAVDSLRIADPRLAPAASSYRLRLVASSVRSLDIALVRTRELIGRVTSPSGARLGGITVELRSADGSTLIQTRTFADGEFYFPRVQPGTFTVSIAETSLTALNATSDPERHSVTMPFEAGPAVRLPPFILR